MVGGRRAARRLEGGWKAECALPKVTEKTGVAAAFARPICDWLGPQCGIITMGVACVGHSAASPRLPRLAPLELVSLSRALALALALALGRAHRELLQYDRFSHRPITSSALLTASRRRRAGVCKQPITRSHLAVSV